VGKKANPKMQSGSGDSSSHSSDRTANSSNLPNTATSSTTTPQVKIDHAESKEPMPTPKVAEKLTMKEALEVSRKASRTDARKERHKALGLDTADYKKNVISKNEIAKHRSADDCWLVLGHRVIDVTEFIDLHPGGRKCLFKRAGECFDCTADFEFHSPLGRKMWFQYQIGVVEGVEERGKCAIM
jgi:cytochrome b involved in lipid metabolism